MTRIFPTALLIDLPNWVGDTMMALPAVTILADANRQGTTVLNTRPSMARFLRAVFPTAEVVTSPVKASPFASARRLRSGLKRCDVGVTFRNAYRAKIFLHLASRQTFGSTGQGAAVLLSHHFTPDRERHQAFDADPILEQLMLKSVTLTHRPAPPEELVAEGLEVMRQAGLGSKPMVGLAPATASTEAKRWPAEKFAALATAIGERGFDPVVLIGPGEGEFGDAVTRVAQRPVRVLGHDLDIAGLAGLAAQMKVIIGVDSGVLHVASVMGTTVVALFGPTVPLRTAPSGPNDEVLFLGLACAPCRYSRCPLDDHPCMGGHDVESVVAAVLRANGRISDRKRRSGAGA